MPERLIRSTSFEGKSKTHGRMHFVVAIKIVEPGQMVLHPDGALIASSALPRRLGPVAVIGRLQGGSVEIPFTRDTAVRVAGRCSGGTAARSEVLSLSAAPTFAPWRKSE